MSDFDTAVIDMTNDLLDDAGGSFVYHRGNGSATLTARKSVGQSVTVDAGDGVVMEVHPVDFICLTTALPYDPPEKGDTITGGGLTYEVMPTVSEKVYRQITGGMTRIHTQRIRK